MNTYDILPEFYTMYPKVEEFALLIYVWKMTYGKIYSFYWWPLLVEVTWLAPQDSVEVMFDAFKGPGSPLGDLGPL